MGDTALLPRRPQTRQVPGTTPVGRRRLLEIRIISAQHLPKPEGAEGLSDILDPYVKVKVIGHPIDKRKRQTHVVSDNGTTRINRTSKRSVSAVFSDMTYSLPY